MERIENPSLRADGEADRRRFCGSPAEIATRCDQGCDADATAETAKRNVRGAVGRHRNRNGRPSEAASAGNDESHRTSRVAHTRRGSFSKQSSKSFARRRRLGRQRRHRGSINHIGQGLGPLARKAR